jgi:zinc and cadmium transporter
MGLRVLWIAIAVLLDGAAGLAGALLPERALGRAQPSLLGFAVGAVLAAALLDLMPEAAARLGTTAFTIALASFVVLSIVEWMTPRTIVPALLGSDALHNIADGAAIAAAFLASTRLGVVTSAVVILHEVPEEVGDYVILRSAGIRRTRALALLAAVQLTAAIGALAVLFASAHWAHADGPVLAIAAGTFLYVGATNLLPELLRGELAEHRLSAALGLVLGAGLMFVVT